MSSSQSQGQCANCRRTFALLLVHNGFNDSWHAYCDRCGQTALLNGWATDLPPGLAGHEAGTIPSGVEPLLTSCPCGGRFRAHASPRCPHCATLLLATAMREAIERDAPGV